MSAPSPSARFLEALEHERRSYAAALPDRIRALGECWRRVRAAPHYRAGLEGIERAAHGLAGSGAVFGFHRLSAEARDLERLLAELAASHDPPEGASPRIEAAILRIEECLGGGAP